MKDLTKLDFAFRYQIFFSYINQFFNITKEYSYTSVFFNDFDLNNMTIYEFINEFILKGKNRIQITNWITQLSNENFIPLVLEIRDYRWIYLHKNETYWEEDNCPALDIIEYLNEYYDTVSNWDNIDSNIVKGFFYFIRSDIIENDNINKFLTSLKYIQYTDTIINEFLNSHSNFKQFGNHEDKLFQLFWYNICKYQTTLSINFIHKYYKLIIWNNEWAWFLKTNNVYSFHTHPNVLRQIIKSADKFSLNQILE